MSSDAPEQPAARGLLLDIGGVILRSGRELILRRTAHEPTVADFVARTDFGGPGDELWAAMIRHELTEREYWTRTSAVFGRELGHDDWVTADLIAWLYHSPEADWLVTGTLDLMTEVKAAGLGLGALTNDMLDFHGQAWVDAQDWLRHFDVVVDASETGVLKPDPGAYALAIEAMGLAPSEIVYLDDMPVNVRAALDAGLQAIEVVYADRDTAMDEARRRLGLRVPDS